MALRAESFKGHARLQFDICGSHPKIAEMIRRFSDRSLVSAFLTAQSSLRVISTISTTYFKYQYTEHFLSGMRARCF